MDYHECAWCGHKVLTNELAARKYGGLDCPKCGSRNSLNWKGDFYGRPSSKVRSALRVNEEEPGSGS